MGRHYSLAFLTAPRLTPAEAIRLAHRTGYSHVGLRLLPASPGGPAYPLHADVALMAEALAALAATGIGVFDLEIIRIAEGFRAADHLPFLEAGQRLGARAVLVAGDDPDRARLTAGFAALCDAAAPFGLTCDLEFMPWTQVKDCAAAATIVAAVRRPNARVLVDALHFARSGSTLAQVAALPPAALSYAQICDAPPGIPATEAEMIFTARAERLLPGEGGIDLRTLFAALPADLPASVEVPSESRIPALGQEVWAAMALAAARRVLEP